ncbi:helix-turn-helix transcriptional regulator, partial [Paraburkholderia dipogonis]|uniref:helix-turn-helix transcriptional regulator n=2 Tax=Paraburkholderia dipogonis TaxID=1211383 RepID=UPI0036255AF6
APIVVTPMVGKTNCSGRTIQRNFLAHEVCDILKIGRTTLFKLVKSRQLVPLHITARIRVFPQSAIEAFLAKKGGK